MKTSLEQTVGIAQEQTIKGQKEGGLPPPVGRFHGFDCFCEDCRRSVSYTHLTLPTNREV